MQSVLVERAVVEPDESVFAFLHKLGDPLHDRHEEVLVRLLGEGGLELGDERLELHAVVLVDGQHDVLLLRSHRGQHGVSSSDLVDAWHKFKAMTKQPATVCMPRSVVFGDQ